MYYDLNVPLGPVTESSRWKTSASSEPLQAPVLSERDQRILNDRLNILVHLGYTVIALNQTIRGQFNAATHVNTLLRVQPRNDVLILRRLTIVLDEDCEKGFGLVNGNSEILKSYDIIALCPMTLVAFNLACQTHTSPSPVGCHIISVDLQSNNASSYFRKVSTIRTAIKNGAVFELSYSPAVKRTTGERNRRNWWVNSKEVVRATGGKGIIFSSGAHEADVRCPKDIINLATLLGCKQDQAHHAMTTNVKAVILRAQTRQTYRAVLSEPRLILPQQFPVEEASAPEVAKPPPERPDDAQVSTPGSTSTSTTSQKKRRAEDPSQTRLPPAKRKKRRGVADDQ